MFNISVDSTKSDAISELDRRLKNPFWSGFALAWITWNWRVWYLTFFVSESLVGNKIAEIQRMYDYFGWNALPGFLLNWLIIPVCISGIITFWLPKLTDKFLKKQKENKEKEDQILRRDLKSEEKNINAMTDLLEAERKKVEEELKKAELELQKLELTKKSKTEQQDWNEEYILLNKHDKDIFGELSTLIHVYGGKVNYGQDFGYDKSYRQPTFLKIFTTYDLIKVVKRDNDIALFELTEKGKYFLKKQTLET